MTEAGDTHPSARWEGAWIDLVDAEGPVEIRSGSSPGLRRRLEEAGLPVATPGRTIICSASALVPATPDGPSRLVCLVEQPWTLMGVIERLRGAGPAMGTTRRRSVARRLAALGWDIEQRHALLRSSRQPVAAVDLDAPRAASVVIEALLVQLRGSGPRRWGLRLLRSLIQRRQGERLVASVLVSCRRRLDGEATRPDRITGQIGIEASRDVLYVRGEPPMAAERRYEDPAQAHAEADALTILAQAGFPLAPRLLGRPAANRTLVSWLAGDNLDPTDLAESELVTWTRRAAAALRVWQGLTRAADGTVIVHGDYWLGNLLVDGDEIVGILDWAAAGRGEAATDAEFLAASAVDRSSRPPALAERLRQVVAEELGRDAPD